MSAWIFQGNPKRFDVNQYLLQHYHREPEELTWIVPPRSRIQGGDRAFMWRSDGPVRASGGLIAIGRVVAGPEFVPDDSPELWAPNEVHATQMAWHVRIRFEELRLRPDQGMLLRVDLEKDPVLPRLQILRYRAVTVSLVSDAEERELMQRWTARRPSNAPGTKVQS